MPHAIQIEKPVYSRKYWFKFIAIRVVFPPILLWDGIKAGMNALFGSMASRVILSAQKKDLSSMFIDDAKLREFSRESYVMLGQEISYRQYDVITHDGACLDTLEIEDQEQKDKPAKDKNYVINFTGNASCYEENREEMEELAQLKYTIIGFNHRKVGRSTGKLRSINDLVIDGIAQVERLLQAGVPAENIVLYGYSLGGAVSALVAAYFYKERNLCLPVFNCRSFSTLTNVVVGWIRNLEIENSKFKIGNKDEHSWLGWLLYPLVKLAIVLVGWEMNAAEAFKSLPETHREYILVRSTKNERQLNPARIDDTVITNFSAMHMAFKDERRKRKQEIKTKIDAIEKNISNLRMQFKTSIPSAEQSLIKMKKTLEKERDEIKKNKRKMSALDPEKQGHIVSLCHLKNAYGVTAWDFFKNFIQESKEKNKKKIDEVDEWMKDDNMEVMRKSIRTRIENRLREKRLGQYQNDLTEKEQQESCTEAGNPKGFFR